VCIPDDPDFPPGSWLCCEDCANAYHFTTGGWSCRECTDPGTHFCPDPGEPDNPDRWVCCWGDDCAFLVAIRIGEILEWYVLLPTAPMVKFHAKLGLMDPGYVVTHPVSHHPLSSNSMHRTR
jgi:hypothetical protein